MGQYRGHEFHSTTSSVPASSEGGTARPSAFAVLRLIASRYLVGVCRSGPMLIGDIKPARGIPTGQLFGVDGKPALVAASVSAFTVVLVSS